MSRNVDRQIENAISDAASGKGPWIVAVVGASKVGKSRSLFEALRRISIKNSVDLIAPKDGESLRSLLQPGQELPTTKNPVALWIDDLEIFLAQGVGINTLREWQCQGDSRFVLCTYGGKGSDLIADRQIPEVPTLASQLLQHAMQIPLLKTTKEELLDVECRLNDDELAVAVEHGLAAYFVAGDRLNRKLTTGRHEGRIVELRSEIGLSVAEAVIDWHRCGRTDSMSLEMLERIIGAQSQNTILNFEDSFKDGLLWALRPVTGSIAIIQSTPNGYKAYDYVVRLRAMHQPDVLSEFLWREAVDTATANASYAVGLAASRHQRVDDAEKAFRRAATSTSDELASSALLHLGHLLTKREDFEAAISAFKSIDTRYASADHLRTAVYAAKVARADLLIRNKLPEDAVNLLEQDRAIYVSDPNNDDLDSMYWWQLGRALTCMNRDEEGLLAYAHARSWPDPRSRGDRLTVLQCLVSESQILHRLNQHSRAYDSAAAAIELIGDDQPSSEESEAAVEARHIQSLALLNLCRFQEGIASCEKVITSSANRPEPRMNTIRWHALRTMWTLYAKTDDFVAALNIAEQTLDQARASSKGNGEASLALVNKGVALLQLGRKVEALAAFEEAYANQDDDGTYEFSRCEYLKSEALDSMGRAVDASVLRNRLIDQYSSSPSAVQREIAATAALRSASKKREQNLPLDALQIVNSCLSRFSDDSAIEILRVLSNAQMLKARILGDDLGDRTAEMECYRSLISNRQTETDRAIIDSILWAMNNLAVEEKRRGAFDEALYLYDTLLKEHRGQSDYKAQIAQAIVNRGALLGEAGRAIEENEAYLSVIEEYSDETDPLIVKAVSDAIFNQSFNLQHVGEYKKATAGFRTVLSRHAADDDNQHLVTLAQIGIAQCLVSQDQLMEALPVLQDVIDRFDGSQPSGLFDANRQFTIRARLLKATTLGRLGRISESLSLYRSIVQEHSGRREIAGEVLAAVSNLAVNLEILELHDDALRVYLDILDRPQIYVAESRLEVAALLLAYAERLSAGRRHPDAVRALTGLIGSCSALSGPEADSIRSRAMLRIGEAVTKKADKIAAYKALVETFSHSENSSTRGDVANGLVRLGDSLTASGRSKEALDIYRKLIDLYGHDSQLSEQTHIAERSILRIENPVGEAHR